MKKEVLMRILSLDGGGFLGYATAAFLKELERHFDKKCFDRFDFFCGTSTGAIIALLLASGRTAEEVCAIYEEFGPRVFKRRFGNSKWLNFLYSVFRAQYSNHELRKRLENSFGEATFGDLRESGKYALVTAYSLTNGRPRIFKTDHSKDLSRDDSYPLWQVALASSAAPTYFPIISIKSPSDGGKEWYCDGGVFSNHPAMIAYVEALCELDIPPGEIEILSISTPRVDLREMGKQLDLIDDQEASMGLRYWASRLVRMNIDSTSKIADTILERVAQFQGNSLGSYERVELGSREGLDFDRADKYARQQLHQIGVDAAAQVKLRKKLRKFFI